MTIVGPVLLMAAFVLPTVPSDVAILPRPVVGLFHLDPVEIQRSDILPWLKKWDVSVKRQVFRTPRAGESQDQYETEWEKDVGKDLDWLRREGLGLIAGGDDACREPYQRAALETMPEAAWFVGKRLRDFGRCHVLDACDESNTKIPAGWDPAPLLVPWRAAGGPPVAFPALDHPSPLEPEASATARQWKWFSASSLGQRIRAIWNCTRKLPPGRVLSSLVCAIERVERVQPNGSTLSGAGGVRPGEIMAQTWAALARNASVLEYYAWDSDEWQRQRADAKPGAVLWTGARPGSALWADLETTLSSIRGHERELAGQPYRALWRPPHLFGRRGKFAWSVHMGTGRVRFREA